MTSALDSTVKLWDARNLNGPIQYYRQRHPPRSISISHKGVVAYAMDNLIEVYKNNCTKDEAETQIYLRHNVSNMIRNIEFCPYEDILGIAHSGGFSSMLVPGCGEPNYDALESNPFQTKSQRKEAEVKALLSKVI